MKPTTIQKTSSPLAMIRIKVFRFTRLAIVLPWGNTMSINTSSYSQSLPSFHDKIVTLLDVGKPPFTKSGNSSTPNTLWMLSLLTFRWLIYELYCVHKDFSQPGSISGVWNHFRNWTLHGTSCVQSSYALSGCALSQKSDHIWDTLASWQWSEPSVCGAGESIHVWRVCSRWCTCMVLVGQVPGSWRVMPWCPTPQKAFDTWIKS